MKNRLVIVGLLLLSWTGWAHDAAWLVEQAPVASNILLKSLENSPPFSASVQITVSGRADSTRSSALATMEFTSGNIRWEAKLADIQSAQMSASAKAVVQRMNGNLILVLTRTDRRGNYLVFPGARVYLEQPLPPLRVSAGKALSSKENIDGVLCSKHMLTAVQRDGKTNHVLIWRAKDLKNLPVQIQITEGSEVIQIRMREVRFRTIVPGRFRLPAGLTRHDSIEDMIQSVLIDRVRRRLGLE